MTQSKETVFSKIWSFYDKSKILTILFIVKYEKIALFVEFLVLLGPIISRIFACSNEEKTIKGACSCPISMVPTITPHLIFTESSLTQKRSFITSLGSVSKDWFTLWRLSL